MGKAAAEADFATTVHRLFLGAAEYAKHLFFVALLLDLAASLVAGWRSFSPDHQWSGWLSLLIAVQLLAASAFRLWAKRVHGHAEACRRQSARAFARGGQVPPCVVSDLQSDSPILAEWFAARLPTATMEAYYAPTLAAGTERLREMIAHSSFYTWRLLRVSARAFLAIAICFALIGAAVIYSLALSPSPTTISGQILDLVCTLVFVVVAGKAAEASIESSESARLSKRIADASLQSRGERENAELATEYDIERSSAPLVPTVIYRMMRRKLKRDWAVRSCALTQLAN